MSSADRGVPIGFPTRSQTSLDLRVRTIAREVEMESPGFETGACTPVHTGGHAIGLELVA